MVYHQRLSPPYSHTSSQPVTVPAWKVGAFHGELRREVSCQSIHPWRLMLWPYPDKPGREDHIDMHTETSTSPQTRMCTPTHTIARAHTTHKHARACTHADIHAHKFMKERAGHRPVSMNHADALKPNWPLISRSPSRYIRNEKLSSASCSRAVASWHVMWSAVMTRVGPPPPPAHLHLVAGEGPCLPPFVLDTPKHREREVGMGVYWQAMPTGKDGKP